ncbi:MAG: undecaprenyl/decaprenyl-phosphate alpha-N-acetylglucosaminyl 1-phosphate transferase [Clostridiales bacterium]|nr:undecaprenyl/decaprenyl-phosphate alpha-N-acetylglucosaminyl 1-phosphate transferase [Clostridiales bacterium]
MEFYYLRLFLMFLIPLLTSLLVTPQVIKMAHHINAIDVPKDERRVHTKPMPRIGGLAIYISFLLAILLFGNFSKELLSIVIASFIIIVLGLFDDVKPVPAKIKFLLHIISASIVVLYGNLLISNIGILGFTINLGYYAIPLTILFIVSCMNIINLIDGLDGLATGISSIYFLTIIVISLFQERFGTLELFLAISMLGSSLGFLKYNFNPAKTFLGDTGSVFLGFIIGITSVVGFKSAMITSLIVPLLILSIPIFDTLFAIFRRKLKNKPIFDPDKDHFHHQILKMRFSHKKTVLIIYLINTLFSIASIFYVIKEKVLGGIVYIVLFILTFWFVFHTNILSDKINLDNKK